MRSREALANWVLCATVNAVDEGRQLSFTTAPDPVGGDGIVLDEKTGDIFPTEHVMVPLQQSGGDAQTLILKAIDDKRSKGEQYASGMTLVVFVNATTDAWFPNKVARALPDPQGPPSVARSCAICRRSTVLANDGPARPPASIDHRNVTRLAAIRRLNFVSG